MKVLLFTGSVTSEDKEPVFCREETEVGEKEISFKSYPLSLLKAVVDMGGITADGIRYEWHMLPITINKIGKHVNVYRDVVLESITVTVELKSDDTEGNL